MKFKVFPLVCFVALFSSISAKLSDATLKQLAGTGDFDKVLNEQLLSGVNDVSGEPSAPKPPSEPKPEETTKLSKQHANKNDSIATQLKHLLANITKPSNITEDEEVETTTPYDVKHYLTAEQKYYMLRINLLGIGIRVVHDIIPIPVTNTDQYKTSMEVLLNKVQAARDASANITAGNMQNITLKDAHKLQMEIAHANQTGPSTVTTKKPKGRTTEVSTT